MFIVVGNGRSGSMTIAKALAHAQNADVGHEAVVYPWANMRIDAFDGRLKAIPPFPPEWAIQVERSGKIAGDSNCYFSPFITLIYNAAPQTQFVWLRRHPEHVVASLMNLGFPMTDIDKLQNPIHKGWEGSRWRSFLRPETTDRFQRLCLYVRKSSERVGNLEQAQATARATSNTRESALHPPFPYNVEQWEPTQQKFFKETFQNELTLT
ncbi:MAG: hypothetical protein Q8K86_07165 [Candidatus Nanopelagicaceae bacterium]|nr:hypothetical protein [Candidatus Nanopelagicaceae bacterium]